MLFREEMGSSNIRARDLVRRINESVKQFRTVLVIAVGLAFALSFAGNLLGNRLLDTGGGQGWYVWAFIAFLLALLLWLLWHFVVPHISYHGNVALRLILNDRKKEVLWSPSWTYMAGASAHQVCEVLQKRGSLSPSGFGNQAYLGGSTWIEDLPGYLVLRWLSGFGLPVRSTGMRLKPIELSDLPAWMGRKNQWVDLVSKLGTPSGLIEASVSRLTVELPEGFRISAAANKQEVAGVVNLQGIAITSRYCKAEILSGPMFPTNQPPIVRPAPAPSIAGMPINAAQPEYYLQQLHDIVVASWPMTFTIEYSAGMLLLRPRKAQRFIEYLSKMADAFVEYFDWDSALAHARAWEKERMYDILMEIQADTKYIRQKVDHQDK